MDSDEIIVLNVSGNIAFFKDVDSVEEISEKSDVGPAFAENAKIIGTLDEYVEDVEESFDDFNFDDGIMHWYFPYE